MEFTTISLPPRDPDFKKHKKAAGENKPWCYLCGREIENLKIAKIMHVVADGKQVSNNPAVTDEPGDLAFMPVEIACVKKHPALVGFTWNYGAFDPPSPDEWLHRGGSREIAKLLKEAGYRESKTLPIGPRPYTMPDHTEGFFSVPVLGEGTVQVSYSAGSSDDRTRAARTGYERSMLRKFWTLLSRHYDIEIAPDAFGWENPTRYLILRPRTPQDADDPIATLIPQSIENPPAVNPHAFRCEYAWAYDNAENVERILRSAGFSRWKKYNDMKVWGWSNYREGFNLSTGRTSPALAAPEDALQDCLRVSFHTATADQRPWDVQHAHAERMLAKYRSALLPYYTIDRRSIPTDEDYPRLYLLVSPREGERQNGEGASPSS